MRQSLGLRMVLTYRIASWLGSQGVEIAYPRDFSAQFEQFFARSNPDKLPDGLLHRLLVRFGVEPTFGPLDHFVTQWNRYHFFRILPDKITHNG